MDPDATSRMRGRCGRRRWKGLAVMIALVLVGCGDAVESLSLEEGVTRELARMRRATIDSLRYTYRLSLPAGEDAPVTGSATIEFRRDDPDGRPVVVDFVDPAERVEAVRVDGAPVEASFEHDHLVLPGGAFADRGPARIELEFRAGDEALNRSGEYLYSLFVPDRAHFSLPIFDQPDLRGRFRLELETPADWVAISNGAVLGEDGEGGAVEFAETEPIPPYLFAFAAGRFEVEEAERADRTLTFHHRETDSARVARNLQAVFDLHGTALEWLEEYADIPYPFQEFGFVAVPSFQYNGMEHPGAVYYRASSLFLEESATQSDRLGRASLIAHETAHMWFGDLVTLAWFDDVWMKEVFANFLAAKIVHPSFPELNHDLRFLLSHHPSAYAVDRTAGAHPIRQELENLREAGTLYGPIIYQKAPIVMNQLELLVGEEVLRDGLREYLDTHRFGSASWTDLIEILDRRTPEDLASWSRVWVEEEGRPVVRAELREDERGRIEALRLEQQDPSGAGRLWPQALDVVLGYGTDSTVSVPVRLLEEGVEVEEAAGLPTPDFVLPGGKGAGYGLFELDPVSREYLLQELPALDDALLRGAGWVTLWDAVLEGAVDPERFLSLALEGARVEDVDLNAERVLGYLTTTWWKLLDSPGRERWAADVEEVLWGRITGDDSRSLRAAFLDAYRIMAVTPEGTARLRRIWAGEEEVPDLPLSERDYIALAEALALREMEEAEVILDAQLERIENPDRRERFVFVRPSLSADPAVREQFFRGLGEPENREREPWVADALAHLNHPLRAEHAERFVRPALEELEEVQRTGDIFFPSAWLDATLAGHNSPAAAAAVRDFLASRPDYPERLRAKILQSADLLFRAASIVHGGPAEERPGRAEERPGREEATS